LIIYLSNTSYNNNLLSAISSLLYPLDISVFLPLSALISLDLLRLFLAFKTKCYVVTVVAATPKVTADTTPIVPSAVTVEAAAAAANAAPVATAAAPHVTTVATAATAKTATTATVLSIFFQNPVDFSFILYVYLLKNPSDI
jgi:hypothetical protein